ncbi:MAG: hypothetical protein HQ530_04430 [Parcubacteria group bacterium]|nr:hypothetical protein [Parcubacteria group bacterium]
MSQNEERKGLSLREQEIRFAIECMIVAPLIVPMTGAMLTGMAGMMVCGSLEVTGKLCTFALLAALPEPAGRVCLPPLKLTRRLAGKLMHPLFDIFEKMVGWPLGD